MSQFDALSELWFAAVNAVDGAEDEGDRVYFGSTNDLDWLSEVIEKWRHEPELEDVYAKADAEMSDG